MSESDALENQQGAKARRAARRSAGKAARQAERDAKDFRRVEQQFLPAALEILETPPSPIGRWIIWLIVIAASFALLWASLAQVDVVATAEGRVIPRARLQSVEAIEAGVIRAIHVREGERVAAGDPLIGLDPSFADADSQSAAVEYATARLARARAEALLAYVDGQAGAFVAPEGSDPAAAAAEAMAVQARIAGLREQLAGVDSRIAGARAAQDAAEADRLALEETLPLIEQQFEARRQLAERGFAAPALVAQWQERVVTQRRALEARRADERRAEAEVAMLARERARAMQDFRAQAAAEQAEAEAITATRAQSVRRAELREGFQTLTAPVDGVVNEIAVTTIGEVVETGSPLVTIVPEGEELIVEALVLNRDVGFVRPGQDVVIKLEAYPFTRHGFLEGEVEYVSADAIADEARGLVFPIRVRITGSRLRDVINPGLLRAGPGDNAIFVDRSGALSPGMAVQVEVITGQRSVASYVLSPVARAAGEAGRER
jgi:hemolysin D